MKRRRKLSLAEVRAKGRRKKHGRKPRIDYPRGKWSWIPQTKSGIKIQGMRRFTFDFNKRHDKDGNPSSGNIAYFGWESPKELRKKAWKKFTKYTENILREYSFVSVRFLWKAPKTDEYPQGIQWTNPLRIESIQEVRDWASRKVFSNDGKILIIDVHYS